MYEKGRYVEIKTGDLDSKLDSNLSESGSDLDLQSLPSSISDKLDDIPVKENVTQQTVSDPKIIKPVVPQNVLVTESNKDVLFPVQHSPLLIQSFL